MVMTSTVIRCHPETFGMGATFGVLSSHVEGSPPKQSSSMLTVPSCTKCEGVLQMLL
jgi:hypothetical protein